MTNDDPNPETSLPPREEDVLIDVKEAMALTGLCERTIREWIDQGKLPAFRLGEGKRPPIRLKKRDVLALLRPVLRPAPTTPTTPAA